MIKYIVLFATLVTVTACSGIRTTDRAYSAHAENFNILFLQIPGGDTQKRAMELVPEGGEIVTINSRPDDITSAIGFLNRLLGFDMTFINGTTNKE